MSEHKELLNNCTNLRNAHMMLAVLLLRCMQKRRALRREVERDPEGFQCCRTCMAREGLQPIFGEDTPEDVTEQLLLASGVKIAKNDGLPQQMCGRCLGAVREVMRFRSSCRRAERSLRGLGLRAPAAEVTKSSEKLIQKAKKKAMRTKKAYRKLKKVMTQENGFDTNGNIDEGEPFDNVEMVELYHKKPRNLDEAQTKEKMVPKSLKCTICEKILKNKHTYIRHMVVHTGDYPYMCEQCGKGLMAHTHLVTHMKAKHGWERTDKCSYCGYLALNKSILQIHERRHTGEKPFVCDHCGMGFHRRANLLQHLPVHLPANTVQCSLCPSAFKSIRFLRTHYNKKHKQKKYTFMCHLCKNYFKTSSNVRMHLTRIHGVPKEEQGPVDRVMISASYLS